MRKFFKIIIKSNFCDVNSVIEPTGQELLLSFLCGNKSLSVNNKIA